MSKNIYEILRKPRKHVFFMYNPGLKGKQMKRILFRYIYCFFSLLLIFMVGMICVYLIPNSSLEPQFSKSKAQLEKEELYPVYLFATDASILDNFMDDLMVDSCRVSDSYSSIFEAAFDNNGYPRYWNGYLLTLRPTMTQFTYHQIRYISMFLLLTAFSFCFSGIHHNLNAVTAVGFAISMIACFLVFVGESLQYFSVFMILFVLLLLILYIPSFRSPSNSALLLFAAGMITNFFDMLTAPLLTLGIPLVLILCLFIKDSRVHSFIKRVWLIINHSLAWGMGYALCWISKWGIGTLATGSNIFEDAMKTAKFRVEGSESIPLDRSLMFRLNFDTYFFAKGHKPAIFILLLLLILTFILIRHHRADWKETVLPFLMIAVFPYVWFFVFANHSQLHYFYTYRIQAISLFAVFAAIGCGLDLPKKVRNPRV